jgi:hypothetical protein
MIKNTIKNFSNKIKNILTPVLEIFLNIYLFKFISMCIKEYQFSVDINNQNSFDSYYNLYPNYKNDKDFILFEDYKYDNFSLGELIFFIKTYPLVCKEYSKEFNFNLFDELIFYICANYWLAKLGFPFKNRLHSISYKFYLLCKSEPALKKYFLLSFFNYLDVKDIEPDFNLKVVEYYHTARRIFHKESPIYTPNKNIKYNSTSIVKNINENTDYTVYFLRKNKSFNKGRYSRNRQNYRTGVYWCLYVNIIALFGLYFYFYRFSFNLGYLWWLLFCLPASFIIPQAIKHRLYNPVVFFNSVVEYLEFLYNCIKIIFKNKK